MNDRTEADKAWEARQEAARYSIFNAATNAVEATDQADDAALTTRSRPTSCLWL